jgi:hypothetical protein
MYGQHCRKINISRLNARLFPAPLPLLNPFQCPPAGLRTKTLQGTSPLWRESLVAPRPVAGVLEKNVPERLPSRPA